MHWTLLSVVPILEGYSPAGYASMYNHIQSAMNAPAGIGHFHILKVRMHSANSTHLHTIWSLESKVTHTPGNDEKFKVLKDNSHTTSG